MKRNDKHSWSKEDANTMLQKYIHLWNAKDESLLRSEIAKEVGAPVGSVNIRYKEIQGILDGRTPGDNPETFPSISQNFYDVVKEVIDTGIVSKSKLRNQIFG